jgi:two-component system phosphate regulon sensor histidine kinase PhoR
VETLEGPARGDAEASDRFIKIVGRNALRLASLVHDLLELSRLESSKFVTSCTTLELRPLVEASLSSLRSQADHQGVALECDIRAGLCTTANAKGLEHVLTNLVQNGINYCHAGSLVKVSARATEDRVQLCVEDDGPGIESQHLSRIFERFYRVDAGRSRSVGGTGLGLSIVRHWVEAMGGTVDVESEFGKGTRFFVFLMSARIAESDNGAA